MLGDFAYYGYGVRRRSSSTKFSRDFVDEKGELFFNQAKVDEFWLTMAGALNACCCGGRQWGKIGQSVFFQGGEIEVVNQIRGCRA